MSREFPTTEEEFELSLELSIGGCYAKSETQILEGETATPSDGGGGEVSRSDFSCEKTHQIDAAENAPEFSDLRRRREMQAMKRREARMKRDFKKSRGVNGGDGGGGDRVVLEFHGGVERREREGIPEEEESARKREKKSNAPPLFGENKVSWGGDYGAAAQFLLPAVGNGYACPLVVPVWGSNAAAGERDGRNSGEVTPENVAAASSSAVYHHRSTSQKGGSSSDTGSHSSSFGTHQSDKVEHLEVNNSSQTEPGRGIVASSSNIQQQQQEAETSKTVEGSTMRAHSNLTDTSCSMVEKPSSSHTSSVTDTPPKLTNSGQDSVASTLRMPFVSTTGNGPNGRTITGFLHKYSKSEVSIMCVCHGSFFSPAGFVEHAGGVNITHPLRHITVVPSILR